MNANQIANAYVTIDRGIARRTLWTVFLVVAVLVSATDTSLATYIRANKMFDIPQTQKAAWGENWCAPTAVGNSFAWLAKEYGLDGLMKVNGTGAALSAEDVIDILGNVDMNTDPASGTDRTIVTQAKKDYIERHGLKDKLTVESMVGLPKQNVDGSFDGYDGTPVTKQWLKDQVCKGQDVEFAVSYYEKIGGKWFRTGGHVDVRDGSIPGEIAGGHQFSTSDIFDPFDSDSPTSFQISFTDPGRDDLIGNFGAIASDQYFLTDFAGVNWFNTASTYNVTYDLDPFGLGVDALLLDGYQGPGDFVADGAGRTLLTVLEAGWAESVPEPSTFILAGISLLGLAWYGGWRRTKRRLS